jgi:hypothetical protein
VAADAKMTNMDGKHLMRQSASPRIPRRLFLSQFGKFHVGTLMTNPRALFFSIVLLLTSCSAPEPGPRPTSVTPLTSPAGKESSEPELSVAPDGTAYLSWIETVGDSYLLRFASRAPGGAWSEPRTISQGSDWFISYADFPSVRALQDGTLAAHWLVTTNALFEAYNINLVFSKDGGKTWSDPIVPHRDGTENQHGFLSMVPAGDSGLWAVWLDGRTMESTENMGLIYTHVGADGSLGEEIWLDNRVCECCQTSAAATPDGMAVVYRDRSDGEIRDISIVRLSNGQWSPPQPLSNDGWEIYGCPVNGPAISSSGPALAAAWFTAPGDKPQVKAALSEDGVSFGQPVQIDDGQPIGRVDVVAVASDESLVSWAETSANGTQIRARYVKADGTRSPSIVVAPISGGLSSGFPRMEKTGDEIVFAWTNVDTSTVQTAVLKLTSP